MSKPVNGIPREFIEKIFAESFGMTADEFGALSPADQVKMAQVNGLGFACSENIAPLDKDGKPITSANRAPWRGEA